MDKRIKKDLQDKDGPFSIGINEISDDFGRLLGDLVEGEFGSNENGTYLKLSSGLLICYKVQQAGHGTRVNLPKTYTQSDYYIGIFPSENQITPGYNSSTVSGTGFSTRMYQGNSSVSNDSPIEVRILTIGR